MLDLLDVREALRARLLTLVVATTGVTNLSATATGYVRAAGSFLTDGFADGMEVLPVGFPTNDRKVIGGTSATGPITATFLPIVGGLTAAAVAGARSLTVGPPAAIQWESTQTPYTTAPGVRPYWYEQFVIGPQDSAADTFSLIADSGQYVITSYALWNKGVLALSRERRAMRALFYPGLQIAVGSEQSWVRVSGLQSGSPIALANGYTTSQYRILWRAVSGNAAAA